MKMMEYIPSDAEVGVGLALRLKTGEFVFFLPGARHKKNDAGNERFYAGIGGHLEPNEDVYECGRREAQEEIGLPIEYEGSYRTVYIDAGKNVRFIEVDEAIKPAAIYEMIHPKDSPKAGKLYHIVIFKALIDKEPNVFQEAEVSGVLLLTPEQVRKGDRRATIGELLAEGARVVGKAIREDTIVYPIGTAKALTLIEI